MHVTCAVISSIRRMRLPPLLEAVQLNVIRGCRVIHIQRHPDDAVSAAISHGIGREYCSSHGSFRKRWTLDLRSEFLRA